jgi:predicted peptidase
MKDELIVRRKLAKFLFTLGLCILFASLLFGAEPYLQVTFFQGSSEAQSAPQAQPTPKKKNNRIVSPTEKAVPFASPAPTPYVNKGFVTKSYTDPQGVTMTYYLNIPNGYVPTQKYPLVLLLHGGGEGSDPNATPAQNKSILFIQSYVQVWGPNFNAPDSPHIQQRWPSFVVIPQIPLYQYWVNVNPHLGSYTMPSQPSQWLLAAKELLDSLQVQYTGIDARRLYITGLSIGGYGVWDAIERWPNYFAAAAPIAGAGDPSKAAVLKNLPIWAFQGSADADVPVSASRDMIAAIKAAGGHPLYTEFPNAGHAVWDMVYSTSGNSDRVVGFFPWLFSQRNQMPEVPENRNVS